MGYHRIVTHNDFDGLVCAALCSHVYGMETIFFTGPRDIVNRRHPITENDIVTDLPYALNCGMWFDHHPGNLEDLKLMGIEPSEIPGRFKPDPSCARTVYDYFSEEWELAGYLADTVDEADMIDSFDYVSIEDWRSPTPGKQVDASIKAPFNDFRAKNRYLKRLALWIRDYPLDQVQEFPEVSRLRALYEEKEKESLDIIRQSSSFLDDGGEREIVLIDLTGYRTRPNIVRHMAYLEYPESKAAIVVANPVIDGIKSTNLTFSMSLSVVMNNTEHGKDIGEIMRSLNIGDGHAGAGAGAVDCSSKDEMIRSRDQTLQEILDLWKNQTPENSSK
jgi:hypothetical protein